MKVQCWVNDHAAELFLTKSSALLLEASYTNDKYRTYFDLRNLHLSQGHDTSPNAQLACQLVFFSVRNIYDLLTMGAGRRGNYL